MVLFVFVFLQLQSINHFIDLFKLMINNEEDHQLNMNLEDSDQMNQDQQALFLRISKSKSVDSIFVKLLPSLTPDKQRSLLWEPTQNQLTNNIIIKNNKGEGKVPSQILEQNESSQGKVFKRIKKERVKSKYDYQKNICGYITKKVIREFVGQEYEKQVMALVQKYGCDYNECKVYYRKRIQLITGPSHLPQLFHPIEGQPRTLATCKQVFREFYSWFLKERYLRYLLRDGKMDNKLAYIEYKNEHLFGYVRVDKKKGGLGMDEQQLNGSGV